MELPRTDADADADVGDRIVILSNASPEKFRGSHDRQPSCPRSKTGRAPAARPTVGAARRRNAAYSRCRTIAGSANGTSSHDAIAARITAEEAIAAYALRFSAFPPTQDDERGGGVRAQSFDFTESSIL